MAVYCHPAYLTYMQSTSCKMPQAGIKIEWITSWNQDCQEKYQQPQIRRWYHFNGRKWKGTKKPLMRVKEESEKASWKLGIHKKKIMASSSITSWQIDGEKVEAVTDFIFLGSKITVDGDCSHEIKKHLLLGRKVMTSRRSIKKQRHHFANEGPCGQRYGFSSSHVWIWVAP